jgi:hypothetical protein
LRPKRAVVPIVIERAEKLAGIKLVLKYDTDLLSYKGADKTPQTSALMHLVNDKQPGRLVVVMAGAVGISGEALPIVNLRFEVRNRPAGQGVLPIEIVETQLMSEKLEELRSPVSVGPER